MAELSSLMQHVASAECLNQDSEFTLDSMMAGAGPLKSDCDEQLIVNFAFGAATKTQALRFVSKPENSNNRPSKVRVYLNERNVIFGNVSGLLPREEVTLQWGSTDEKGNSVALALLPKCRYMASFKLTLFIMENEGDEDVTVVDGMELLGELAAGQGTSELPKKG